MSSTGLSTKNAPSPRVVLPHYAFGAVAFLASSILLFAAAENLSMSFVGPKVLGLTHLMILGWVTMIIFGALYQLVPVVMEVKLYSEKLAFTSFFTMVIGLILMVTHFWFKYIALGRLIEIGGTLVIVSVILFVFNILRSASKTVNKTIENSFIIASVIWLLITVLFGIFIIVNTSVNILPRTNIELLKIHALIGLIGWFMMLIIGVGSTLLPMFFISHKLNRNLLRYSFVLVNTGLMATSAALYLNLNGIYVALTSLIILLGMFSFVKYNFDSFQKRLRKKLDIGMKISVFSFALLFLAIVFGFSSSFGSMLGLNVQSKLMLGFGASLIFGFFTALILGQMYKTLPFIVWLKKYQAKVGKYKTPMPASLYSEKIANIHFYTFTIAIIGLLAGILAASVVVIKISSIAMIITALLYNFNTFKIIFHKDISEPLKK